MASTAPPRPPAGLKRAGTAFWRAVVGEFVLDSPMLHVLAECCRERDRCHAADAILARDGLVVKGPDGRRYPHPCVTVARDARAGFARMVRMLKLDVEPLQDRPGRPLSLVG